MSQAFDGNYGTTPTATLEVWPFRSEFDDLVIQFTTSSDLPTTHSEQIRPARNSSLQAPQEGLSVIKRSILRLQL